MAITGWQRPGARRVRAIRDRLRASYGIPAAVPHGEPLDELILTVLSQSTNDRNRDVAFLALRERFPGGWAEVRDAPVDAVERAIRPGGISQVKSARIKAILGAISDTQPPGPANAAPPAPSLDWLAGRPVDEARDHLTRLPGVGRKTAACVLLFSFGMREVPVDTHVSRVGVRLGLLREGAPFEELHDQLLAITPAGQELEFHLNLLRHGRRICHARRPECDVCPLRRVCPRVGVAPVPPPAPRGTTRPAARAAGRGTT